MTLQSLYSPKIQMIDNALYVVGHLSKPPEPTEYLTKEMNSGALNFWYKNSLVKFRVAEKDKEEILKLFLPEKHNVLNIVMLSDDLIRGIPIPPDILSRLELVLIGNKDDLIGKHEVVLKETKEESQEELWYEVNNTFYDVWRDEDLALTKAIELLQSKFTITRKQTT